LQKGAHGRRGQFSTLIERSVVVIQSWVIPAGLGVTQDSQILHWS